MLTSTERVGRTRIRVTPGPDGQRCQVRSVMTCSDPTAAGLRAVVVHCDERRACVSLVPEGALLLAGDVVELDVAVDAGARLDLIEPAGTVAFAMRGDRARWDVRVQVGRDAVLTWAGEPFVVAAGADVSRSWTLDLEAGSTAAVRETLVLGRHGEGTGRLHQRTRVAREGRPILVEDLPIDPATVTGLLGGHRVLASVLLLGRSADGVAEGHAADRLDLEREGHLWRRLADQTHRASLAEAWRAATASI